MFSSPRRRLLLLGSSLAIAVGAALFVWRDADAPQPRATNSTQPASPTADATEPSRNAVGSDAPVAHPVDTGDAGLAELRARFSQSGLRGSSPDGALHLDTAGRVIPDADLRRLFEWYLALTGEFELSDIRSLFAADQRDAYGEAAAADALALFDRYLGLRNASVRIDGRLDSRAYLDALIALRRQWFGDDADAMFGAEETAQAYSLDLLAVRMNPTLDSAERAARLAEIQARQPSEELEARTQFTDTELASEQTRQLDALAADAATRHAERSELFGDDAATRLATLDAERAAWQQRIDDYVRARDALRNDTTLDPASRTTQLAALRERSFAEHERRRIDALDAIGALPPGG